MAGAMKWDEQWAEAFALLFLVLGFVVSILLQSAYFTYLSVFLAGLIGVILAFVIKIGLILNEILSFVFAVKESSIFILSLKASRFNADGDR